MNQLLVKKYPTLGCCGLDCGLCPRYYTEGYSRCSGCCGPNFFKKHPGCGHITCCFKKKGFEVCSLCNDFPCSRFNNWFGNEAFDSFITHKNVESNLNFIKQNDLKSYIEIQNEKIKLLNEMLKNFNEGRSRSFYCIATTLFTLDDIKKSIDLAKKEIKKLEIKDDDFKFKAKIIRKIIQDIADKKHINLKLRRPTK